MYDQENPCLSGTIKQIHMSPRDNQENPSPSVITKGIYVYQIVQDTPFMLRASMSFGVVEIALFFSEGKLIPGLA